MTSTVFDLARMGITALVRACCGTYVSVSMCEATRSSLTLRIVRQSESTVKARPGYITIIDEEEICHEIQDADLLLW